MLNLNKPKTLLVCLILILSHIKAQNIPSIGRAKELEIGNWNIEWFGKTAAGFGPANDSMQQRLVKTVLQASDIDIWVLCEVSDTGAYGRLMRQMPEYSGVLSNYFPEQKTAVIYKKTLFSCVSSQLLGLSNKDSFSTGRYPLKTTLVSQNFYPFDTIDVIAVHLKSNTGSDSLKNVAYNSRKRSAEWLKAYTYTQRDTRKYIIAGDWNDDLDVSIYKQLPSSLLALKNESNGGNFITQRFSTYLIATTASYPDAIDHQFVSGRLYEYYTKDSAFVWRIDQYIGNYASTCSDHFPVISRYNSRNYGIASKHYNPFKVYPIPATDDIKIDGDLLIQSVNLIDLSGSIIPLNFTGESWSLKDINCGLYYLEINSQTGSFRQIINKL